MERAHCETCMFSDLYSGDWLRCRRNPPQVWGQSRGSVAGGGPITEDQAFPRVKKNDWCGEHRPKMKS